MSPSGWCVPLDSTTTPPHNSHTDNQPQSVWRFLFLRANVLTDEDKNLIYEQIAAQKQAESASQREATAKSVHNALLVQISEDAAKLSDHAKQLIQNHGAILSAIVAINEKLEDLHARQAVIDRHTKLILELERTQITHIKDRDKRKELEGKIDEAQSLSLEQASIRRRLQIQINNLSQLQEQAASFGGREPLDLINQITNIQEIIQDLQAELRRVAE